MKFNINHLDSCRVRDIQINDFQYIVPLLGQLTDIELQENNSKHKDMYSSFINYLENNSNHYIKVLENENKEIIGMGTIVMEPKIIHCFSKIAHIEDIVIYKKYRGKSYGTYLIHQLIEETKKYECYKVVLYCNKELQYFYEKTGLCQNNIVHLEIRN